MISSQYVVLYPVSTSTDSSTPTACGPSIRATIPEGVSSQSNLSPPHDAHGGGHLEYCDDILSYGHANDDCWSETSDSRETHESNTVMSPFDINTHFDRIHGLTLIEYQQHSQQIPASPYIPDTIVHAMELLCILKMNNAPATLYDHILKWAYTCKRDLRKEKLPSRERVLAYIAERYNLKCLRPRTRECILPSIALPIPITVTPILGSIYSLLTSQYMKSDCLTFEDPSDPAIVSEYNMHEEMTYGEVNTGWSYHSYVNSIRNRGIENAVVVPIVAFTDATFIDVNGKHTSEPAMFTLGIFGDHVRNQPDAWRHIGFIKKEPEALFDVDELDAAKNDVEKSVIPDAHRDYHAQMNVIFADLENAQNVQEGFAWQFTIDGKLNPTIYRLFFPIIYIVADTVGGNKVCSIKSGNKSLRPCRICDIKRDDLDNLSTPYNYLIASDIAVALASPGAASAIGFHPCHDNIFYRLTYCDPNGINSSLPPESLHVVLLGCAVRVINGFSRSTQDPDTSNPNSAGKYPLVFSPKFLKDVENGLLSVGKQLAKQCDPDLPRTKFASGYLPDPRSDDGTTAKKSGHELRGVLVTILVFILLNGPASTVVGKKEIQDRLGSDRLSGFVKLFELIILFESWLRKDCYVEREVAIVEKFMPFLVGHMIDTVQREDGNGLKHVKIHLLSHMCMTIRLFGKPGNVDGMGPESHLKRKIKAPSRLTRMQTDDFELRTADKDYESILIETGVADIMRREDDFVLRTIYPSLAKIWTPESQKGLREGTRYDIISDGNGGIRLRARHTKMRLRPWKSKLIDEDTLTAFLAKVGICAGHVHTEYNHVNGFKVRGNPLKDRHEWVVAKVNNNRYVCQILCFVQVNLYDVCTENTTYIDTIDRIGSYAVVHFCDQDVFGDRPSKAMYGARYQNFMIDAGNSCLTVGWCKHTDNIDGQNMPRRVSHPTVALLKTGCILEPCVGVHDHRNVVPYSYVFLPRQNTWADKFVPRILDLMPRLRHTRPINEMDVEQD